MKNVGATFTRLIVKVLADQLVGNTKAYIDDIVIKSRLVGSHTADLQETFANLRTKGVKLNP